MCLYTYMERPRDGQMDACWYLLFHRSSRETRSEGERKEIGNVRERKLILNDFLQLVVQLVSWTGYRRQLFRQIDNRKTTTPRYENSSKLAVSLQPVHWMSARSWWQFRLCRSKPIEKSVTTRTRLCVIRLLLSIRNPIITDVFG